MEEPCGREWKAERFGQKALKEGPFSNVVQNDELLSCGPPYTIPHATNVWFLPRNKESTCKTFLYTVVTYQTHQMYNDNLISYWSNHHSKTEGFPDVSWESPIIRLKSFN
jgi:hypothetical protein